MTVARFALMILASGLWLASPAQSQQQPDFEQSVLHDPDAPVAGNPKGDVTIVEFSDYNCPYCRRSTVELDRYIASDPNVRVVYRDWPILAASSVIAAKVAIAANYQGKYSQAHDALMAIKTRPASKEAIKLALEDAHIDIARLNADLTAHNDDIYALLKRTLAQAKALGFDGTPVFLIGSRVEAREMTFDGFKQIVSEVRAGRTTGRRTLGQMNASAVRETPESLGVIGMPA